VKHGKPPRYFQGLINKIQGLSSSKKIQDFPGCGNPVIISFQNELLEIYEKAVMKQKFMN